jgi:MFS family permease
LSEKRLWLAFRAPGYRWLWLFALFSAMAFTVESLSYGWAVLQLTNSAFWIGVAAAVRGASHALFSVLGGPIVDRTDRRRLLLAAQLAAAVAALTLAWLLIGHRARLWHILCYLILVGSMNAIVRPAVTGLLYDVVGPQRLLNASAFQFVAASLVRIVGAVAGGFIIDRLGVGKNFLLVSAAYCGGSAALFMLRRPGAVARVTEPFVRAVATGFGYVLRAPQILTLLLMSVAVEAFGFGYMAMMPVMARDVLKVGAVGLGYLSAMAGVGQLVAMLVVASRGDLRHKEILLVAAATGFGLFIALFGLSPWFSVSLALVMVVGALGSTYDTTMSTMLTMAAGDDVRGRVLGLYFSTMGISAFGWLGVGAIAGLVGMPMALAASGGIVALAALGGLTRLRERRADRPEGEGFA